MTSGLRTSRRLTSVVVAIGLLGACAVLVVLVDSPGQSSAVRGLGHPARPTRPARPARPRRPSAAEMAPARLTAPARRAGAAAGRMGLRLLSQAAVACQSVPFHGVQIATWFGSPSQTASVIQVWHRPDGQIVVQATPTGTSLGQQGQASSGLAAGQDDVLSVTPPLLTLMRRNYVISYAGRSAVDGRPALLVDVRYPGGGLAARFWVDVATRLPLRRELLEGSGRILSEDAFLSLSIGAGQLQGMPSAGARPGTAQLTAAGRTALAGQGWLLPGPTIGGLSLFQSTTVATKSGKVAELSYSDGLSVISVFVQRGVLPRSMPGWRRFPARDGSVVYAIDPDDQSLVWSSGGFVYTLISNAPPAVVDRTVLSLPHHGPLGFWGRMGRGFRRLVSWADPFG